MTTATEDDCPAPLPGARRRCRRWKGGVVLAALAVAAVVANGPRLIERSAPLYQRAANRWLADHQLWDLTRVGGQWHWRAGPLIMMSPGPSFPDPLGDGDLDDLARFPLPVRHVAFHFTPTPGDTDWGRLADMPYLESLHIGMNMGGRPLRNREGYPTPSDAGVTGLARSRSLRRLELDIDLRGITDLGAERLAAMSRLKEMRLLFTRGLTSRAFAAWASMPRLEQLTVGADGFNDNMAEALAASRSLRHLHLHLLPRDAVVMVERVTHPHWSRSVSLYDRTMKAEADAPATFTDRGMAQWARMRRLETLDLISLVPVAVDAEGWAALGTLPVLRELRLHGFPGLDADGLAHLARAPDLRRLDLAHCSGVDDAAVARLAFAPGLTYLSLDDIGRFTGAGFAVEGGFAALSTVLLTNLPALSEEGLAALAALPALTRLELIGCEGLTPDALARLAASPSLRELAVHGGGAATKEGLMKLAAAPTLREVSVRGKEVGAADLTAFKMARPDCTIPNPGYSLSNAKWQSVFNPYDF